MLQMRLALANIARPTHAGIARRLGEGALHAATRLIYLMEIGRLLTSTCGLYHVMAFSRKAQRHAPPGRLRFGALCPEQTGMAGRLSEPDTDD